MVSNHLLHWDHRESPCTCQKVWQWLVESMPYCRISSLFSWQIVVRYARLLWKCFEPEYGKVNRLNQHELWQFCVGQSVLHTRLHYLMVQMQHSTSMMCSQAAVKLITKNKHVCQRWDSVIWGDHIDCHRTQFSWFNMRSQSFLFSQISTLIFPKIVRKNTKQKIPRISHHKWTLDLIKKVEITLWTFMLLSEVMLP